MRTSVVDSTEGELRSADGLRLHFRRWEIPSPKAVCLLVHGVAEHSGRYPHVAEALGERGYSSWAIDHRGHGRSEGQRGDCSSLQDFVGDLHLLAREARSAHPDLPMAVVGHSLGGLIGLEYAAQHPQEIRAVAVSSPALKLAHETSPFTVALVTATSRIFPNASFHSGVNPKLLCHDPAVVEAYANDPLVHHKLSARCAVALRQAMLGSPSLAERVKIPCLILQAGSDEVCDPRSSEALSRKSGGRITFKRYDGFYHELFNEPEKERVLSDLCDWLDGALRS